MITCVALDIGETLVSDTRFWAGWADWLGVPRHTVSALVGAVVSRGDDNSDALRLLRPGLDVAAAVAAREAAGRGEHLDETDLYPDVRPALAALRQSGVRVLAAGNQTARAGALLRALDLPVDAVATSGEWGVAKPDPAFFARLLELAGTPADRTLYVGDHPSDDIHPAKEAGLRTAHLRRGPWGYFWADDPEVVAAADFRVESLTELVGLVGAGGASSGIGGAPVGIGGSSSGIGEPDRPEERTWPAGRAVPEARTGSDEVGDASRTDPQPFS